MTLVCFPGTNGEFLKMSRTTDELCLDTEDMKLTTVFLLSELCLFVLTLFLFVFILFLFVLMALTEKMYGIYFSACMKIFKVFKMNKEICETMC